MEIKKIKLGEKNYPELLEKIKDPPKILYVLGEIFRKESCFAIVGTRKCSEYGKEVALDFSSKLSEAGFTIVSGFAPGVDTFAHLGAIEKKKRTIAVLGTGLDKKSIYPKSNLKLIEKILDCGGCLISEYPPEQKGTKFTFPKRNRIISGLSLGVLVVEAKLKSGALITANFAREQKRKVFAIPGSIYSQLSKGSHFLIKTGA
ncbi:DNA-protecting protein DprA, partial [Candidatus Parcubacteria bacterium]|nr:DNA-protecting protein DprA [Candidatus Parcubacteria bacterium]